MPRRKTLQPTPSSEDLAGMLGVSIRTLRNRSRFDLPDFVKARRRRLFVEESVRDYLRRKTVAGLD